MSYFKVLTTIYLHIAITFAMQSFNIPPYCHDKSLWPEVGTLDRGKGPLRVAAPDWPKEWPKTKLLVDNKPKLPARIPTYIIHMPGKRNKARMESLIHPSFINIIHAVTPGKQAKNSLEAVILSHRKAIQIAYDRGDKVALVLEDDAEPVFYPFWDINLEQYVKQMNLYYRSNIENWSTIQLGTTKVDFIHKDENKAIPIYPNPPPHNQSVQGSEWGAFAYLISRIGMEQVLKRDLHFIKTHYQSWARTADDALLGFTSFNMLKNRGRPGQFVAHPPLFSINLGQETLVHDDGSGQSHWRIAAAGKCTALYEAIYLHFNYLKHLFQ